MCRKLDVARSAYYRWKNRTESTNELENSHLTSLVEKIHAEHPEMGYRRICDEINARYGDHVNDKRILRICRMKKIQSSIKWKPSCCTRANKEAQHIQDNILNRDFTAEAPNQKWLTDVSEFKYSVNGETRKVYLSAILDLYDRRLVAYRISNSNDNSIVMSTFEDAFTKEQDAHPLCHSDRGFQYTGPQFYMLMNRHGCIHSMSRIAHCIDNGPMEGFWGILKREMYYGRKFEGKHSLVRAITDYIEYYNARRIQRKLHRMSPMEYHDKYISAA